MIEKAIADLDAKLWEWTDALKSAQAQLRSAFAVRPAPVASVAPVAPAPRPSAALYDDGPMPSLAASAAAAHIPSTGPLPEWMTTAAKPDASEWSATKSDVPEWSPPKRSPQQPSAFKDVPSANEWPQPQHTAQHGGHGASGHDQPSQSTGVMAWPTAPSGANWPTTDSSSSGGPQQWPTWTPTDTSGAASSSSTKKGSVRASKAPKAVRPVVEGPTPEERAQKAAAEEAMLSELEDAIARRVRLLRRLDPDTPIERLIDKAKQGHAEAQASAPPKEDKNASSSSWWRRK